MSRRTERYLERKVAGLCVQCAAGLMDEDTTVHCLECLIAIRKSQDRTYLQRREYRRQWYRERYRNDPVFRAREKQRIKEVRSREVDPPR